MTRRTLTLALLATVALGAPATLAADVHVASSIRPRASRFGDVIRATLTVRGDAPVSLQEGFAPFQVVRESATRTGTVTRWRFELQSLEARCAPGPGARSVTLAPTRVQIGSQVVMASFPPFRIEPRATEAQVANPERSFLHPTVPPRPSYRFAPGTAQKTLIAAAAVLLAVALLLLAPILGPRRARARDEQIDPLERALALVQDARSRPPPDRRRALGLLARVLRKLGAATTGQAAADLAWSEPEPDAARMARLVEQIEKAL
jgi:hypothetical protein